MSRKHYQVIARLLGDAMADVKCGDSAVHALTKLELSFKREFEADNQAFDGEKFSKAVTEAVKRQLEDREGPADSSVEAALRPEDHEMEQVV